MKVLLLNQAFYPDVVSTAQHVSDLAVELAAKGHQVTVVAGNRGYDDPRIRFPRRETWKGIKIIRIPSLGFGKTVRWRRALNFASFLAACTLQLLRLGRFDQVVALTSPPLISLLASSFVQLKGGRFLFWIMDLNPDEAIIAGWLKNRSITARMLAWGLHHSLRRAAEVIVLDRFMKQRILDKGIAAEKITVLPPWSYDDKVKYDREGREVFRAKHDLTDKFVVMYAGNHSPCHPLETLLEAARRLSQRKDLAFCFIGGGTEQSRVRAFAEQHRLDNVKSLPYQPLSGLSAALSAADLHAVVMGDPFPGIVHPCKIYNTLLIGTPVIYIGPAPSHITDIAASNEFPIILAHHGDVDAVVESIVSSSELSADERRPSELAPWFSKSNLLPQMIGIIEGERVGTAKTVDLADGALAAASTYNPMATTNH
jgi:glycosyltransferase involved in cell wall biosynthesis